MLVCKGLKMPDGHYELEYDIDPGEARFETGVEGIRYDFNLGARVSIDKSLLPNNKFEIKYVDRDTGLLIQPRPHEFADRVVAEAEKVYHIHYSVEVMKNGETIFTHIFNLENKNVHIEMMNTKGMGDAICFMPYVEEFRKRHKCHVFVTIPSKFADIFRPVFKDITFLSGESADLNGRFVDDVWQDLPKDIYATYYYEVGYPAMPAMQKTDLRMTGMMRNGANILGLDCLTEFKPRLAASQNPKPENVIKDDYVCISLKGTQPCKSWHNPQGWAMVVRFLRDKGYRVLCIDGDDVSKEDGYREIMQEGCEDFTGYRPLQDRVDLLCGAKFFIGMASGLSWLAWACGRKVVMISGFSLPYSEFYTPYRVINTEVCHGCWNDMRYPYQPYLYTKCPLHQGTDRQFECSKAITGEMVLEKVEELIRTL